MADKPTLGERIASLESVVDERTSSILQRIDQTNAAILQQMANQDLRVTANTHAIATLSKDLSTLQRQVDAFTNRLIGAVLASAALTGGGVFGLVQMFGG